MRFCLLASCVLLAGVPASAYQKTTNSDPVTVSPACPEWQMPSTIRGQMIPPTITFRYNPNARGARLTSSKAVSLVIAEARFAYPYPTTILPMARSSDGLWRVDFTPKKMNAAGYGIFLFRDDNGRVDNNAGQYWDILYCYRSQRTDFAVETQASTYEGRLLAPGFQRQPDLARAIEILKADLAVRPAAVSHYSRVWNWELEKEHRTPAAYRHVAEEIDAFLRDQGKNLDALRQTVSFVAAIQNKIPPDLVQRFRAAVIALPQEADPIEINAVTKEVIHIPREIFARRMQPEVMRDLAELDYWAIDLSQQSPREKAEAYLALADDYPNTPRADMAYQEAFQYDKQVNDIAAAEDVFDDATVSNPRAVWPYTELAQLYVDNKSSPARAVELLDQLQKMYTDSELPSSHVHYGKFPAKLLFLRGQAHLLVKDLPAARTDFQAAVQEVPDNPDFAYALGQVCEQLGDKKAALDAYLAAASAPYEANANPTEAYERLFVALKLGTKPKAEEEINKRVAQRTRAAEAEYTPIAMNRPAPDFAFTDLAGKRFDNASLKGKPAVITFWGIWCVPCIAEMPSIQKVQLQHPATNMLAVEIGNKPDEVKAFLAAHKLRSLHVATQQDWPDGFGLTVAPTTVVLDRFGQIQFLHSGQLSDFEAILGKDLDALPASN